MSNTSANAQTVTVKSDSKPKAFIKKSVNFVKTHKKSTIAVGVLSGLVVANVILEKKANDPLPPMPADVYADTEVIDSSN